MVLLNAKEAREISTSKNECLLKDALKNAETNIAEATENGLFSVNVCVLASLYEGFLTAMASKGYDCVIWSILRQGNITSEEVDSGISLTELVVQLRW
jgi:hypothetical protein